MRHLANIRKCEPNCARRLARQRTDKVADLEDGSGMNDSGEAVRTLLNRTGTIVHVANAEIRTPHRGSSTSSR
jgi:hypothetical protein